MSPTSTQSAMPRLRRSIASRLVLQIEVDLLRHRLADHHRAEALEVRHTLEVEDPLDELVGILHLADRLVADCFAEPFVAPVVAHLGVDEVLVHRGQLRGEDLVEQLDDTSVAVHADLPLSPRRNERASGYGDGSFEGGDVLAHEAFEHAVTTTAVGAGPAPLTDRRHVLGTGQHRGPDGRVVHGLAVTNDQHGLRVMGPGWRFGLGEVRLPLLRAPVKATIVRVGPGHRPPQLRDARFGTWRAEDCAARHSSVTANTWSWVTRVPAR